MSSMPLHSVLHALRIGIFAVMFLNLAYLNLLAVKAKHNNSFVESNTSFTNEESPPLQEECGDDCLEKIQSAVTEATASLKVSNQPVAVSDNAKEHFISFGSGYSSAEEWTDVGGLQTNIDSNNYARIKKVTFEASVYIPTGNQRAFVRLYNSTDKHPVWFSEVSLEGGQAQLLTSPPISLDSGNKLYTVQMKTSLKYKAELLQARVHIITE